MMLACPGCRTVYDVAPARLGSRPRLVRCSACGTKWSYPANPHPPEIPALPVGETAEDSPEPYRETDERAFAVDEPSPGAATDIESDRPTDPAVEPAAEEPGELPPASPAVASAEVDLVETPAEQSGTALEESENRTRRGWQEIRLRPGVAAAASAIATVVALFALLIVLRGPVVAAFPVSAGFYGMLGLLPYGAGAHLRIKDIVSARHRRDGTDVLTVTGIVTNMADEPTSLPTIEITVLDDQENELQSVSFDSERANLAAGEKLAFDKDIPQPSPRARRVRVGFTTTQEPVPE